MTLRCMQRTFAATALNLAGLVIGAAGQSFDPHPFAGPNALKKTHPGYDFSDLLPTSATSLPQGFTAHIGGMAFLPDGRLAVCDFPNPRDDGAWKGSVWILDGVQTGDRSQVKFAKFHDGLYGPTGLTVANGDIYVIDANSLRRLTDKDRNGTAEATEITRSWHQGGGQPAVADLAYHNGFFYSAFGGSGGLSVDGKSVAGGEAKIGMDGAVEKLNTGFRNPGGGGVTLQGDIFATDNQGDWLPSSKLIHVVKGRHYGWGGAVNNGVATSPPAIWIPMGMMSGPSGDPSKWAAGLSPTGVLPILSGAFAGQLLVADIRYGNLHRVNLDKVQGEYQGALFHFSGGFRAGIYRMAWGPDNALYLGGLGGPFYTWSYKDNDLSDDWGLYRMKPNTNPVLEFRSVTAKKEGFLLEFTLPVKAGVAANHFKVQSWRYSPTGTYGGPQIDQKNLAVESALLFGDRKNLFLKIAGLEAGKVVHIEMDSNLVTTDDGRKSWTTEAWYTLNQLSDEVVSVYETAPRQATTPVWIRARATPEGAILVRSDADGTYAIRDARGTLLEAGAVKSHRESRSRRLFGPGIYIVSVNGKAQVRVARF